MILQMEILFSFSYRKAKRFQKNGYVTAAFQFSLLDTGTVEITDTPRSARLQNQSKGSFLNFLKKTSPTITEKNDTKTPIFFVETPNCIVLYAKHFFLKETPILVSFNFISYLLWNLVKVVTFLERFCQEPKSNRSEIKTFWPILM